jgi:hypothetical protein
MDARLEKVKARIAAAATALRARTAGRAQGFRLTAFEKLCPLKRVAVLKINCLIISGDSTAVPAAKSRSN